MQLLRGDCQADAESLNTNLISPTGTCKSSPQDPALPSQPHADGLAKRLHKWFAKAGHHNVQQASAAGACSDTWAWPLQRAATWAFWGVVCTLHTCPKTRYTNQSQHGGVKSFLLLEHWCVLSLVCLICRMGKKKRQAVVILCKNKKGKDPSFHHHQQKWRGKPGKK